MNRLVLDPHDPDAAIIEQAAAVVKLGGVVAYPTETFYGLAVDPRSDTAVRKLFGLKERDNRSAIALIAADAEQAEAVGRFGDKERRLAAAFWPGPLTIVVAPSAAVSSLLFGDMQTIGVRVPAHPAARALAQAAGSCVTATSANVSGRPPAATGSEVAAAFEGRIDLLIDAGPTPGGAPSTIVEVIDGLPRLHRAGAIAWDRVLESLE